MTKKGGYSIENIYQGGTSTLSPDYGDSFTGYRVASGELGAPTKPDTANQIQQLNTLLNQGIVPVEIGALQPEVFDQIPKQHFKEMRRMAKLTGAKLSVHAPIIEPSGIGEQGWNETARQTAERQLSEVVEKSLELEDTESIPITIHSAGGIPGTEYTIENGKKKIDKLVIVDRETGKPVHMLEEKKLYYPDMREVKEEVLKQFQEQKLTRAEIARKIEEGKIDESEIYKNIPVEQGKMHTPEAQLDNMNFTQWDDSIAQLIFNKDRADDIIYKSEPLLTSIMDENGKINANKESFKENPSLIHAYNSYKSAEMYMDDLYHHARALFNKAYKFGSKEQQKKLEKWAEDFRKDSSTDILSQRSNAAHNLLQNLRTVVPDMFIPVEQFAIDKSSQTFANVALNAYQLAEKQGKKAPKISIENMFPGMGFAQGNDKTPGMKQLIEKSQEEFVKKATISKNKGGLGLSESQAKKQAQEMIGMTLDVGHLNIARKKGFQEEDLRKEVEQIAKYVKHVHLTDNFGYADSHLPPGMGNVPIKTILAELEKAGTLKGTRKVVEAGGFVQHFQQSPLAYTFEGMGSPIYSDDAGPYWNQTMGLQQGYMAGYGMMLPQTNYQMFGAGFSQLPQELGGQAQGAQGNRMSGKPME